MVQLFHVSKTYDGRIPCLYDVSVHVRKGEFVFLTGPSGAGKSTLLKMIFAAEQPTRGQILVGGRNVGRIRSSAIPYLRRNIGVVFQDFKLLPNRTVAENVAFSLEVLGTPRAKCREKVDRILERVGLADRKAAFPRQLSGGEQQRVVIARALVNEPALLLADEPTGNLDPGLSVEIMELLSQANIRGTTVLVATHDATLLERYRKRTIRLEQGRLVYDEDGLKAARRMAG